MIELKDLIAYEYIQWAEKLTVARIVELMIEAEPIDMLKFKEGGSDEARGPTDT